MKYRVTYSAAMRKLTYRAQAKTGQLETLDSQPTFNEEKTVTVDAGSQADAILKATAHLPKGCDVSVSATLISPKGASA